MPSSSSPAAGTTPGTGLDNRHDAADDPLAARLGCLDVERRSTAAAFALSCCGRYRGLNQDRVLLDEYGDGVRTLGVFDGHGVLGENAALLARAVLAAGARAGTPLVAALADVHDLLVTVADNEHRRDPHWPYDYGTTAAVARVADGAVDLAWVGDSRVAIFEENARTRSWSWQWSSRDHNPRTNDAEAERLVLADATTVDRGGVRIYPGQIMPIEDAVRQKLTLNMSRALGHRVLGRYGVLAQAESASRRLNPVRATCIICASDGIWDVLDERDLTTILTESLPNGVEAAAEAIVLRSDQEWILQGSGDNMSVVISVIRPTVP